MCEVELEFLRGEHDPHMPHTFNRERFVLRGPSLRNLVSQESAQLEITICVDRHINRLESSCSGQGDIGRVDSRVMQADADLRILFNLFEKAVPVRVGLECFNAPRY